MCMMNDEFLVLLFTVFKKRIHFKLCLINLLPKRPLIKSAVKNDE